MIILGIDPGTVELGYCKIEVPKDKLLDYGLIKLNNKQAVIDFFLKLEHYLILMIHIDGPSELIAEKMFSSRNNKHLALLNVMPRAIKDFCDSSNIIYKEVANTTVKKQVGGSGRATKEEVAEAVCKRFDLKIDELAKKYGKKAFLNVTDAIAIALSYQHAKEV